MMAVCRFLGATCVIRPNFLVIGAPKAATTSLSVMLALHHQVYMVDNKEPHFFSRDEVWTRGWPYYESLFSRLGDEPAIGDASTSYCRVAAFPKALARIAEHVPDARIIYMVRHPLDRMESAYIERMSTPNINVFYPTINDAVREDANLVETSRYWKTISAYRKHFSDDRIKVVFFEDYIVDPDAALAEVYRFLEIDDTVRTPHSNMPVASRESRIQRMRRLGRSQTVDTTWKLKMRKQIINDLNDDVRKFLHWCGKPADFWRLDPKDKTRGGQKSKG